MEGPSPVTWKIELNKSFPHSGGVTDVVVVVLILPVPSSLLRFMIIQVTSWKIKNKILQKSPVRSLIHSF